MTIDAEEIQTAGWIWNHPWMITGMVAGVIYGGTTWLVLGLIPGVIVGVVVGLIPLVLHPLFEAVLRRVGGSHRRRERLEVPITIFASSVSPRFGKFIEELVGTRGYFYQIQNPDL